MISRMSGKEKKEKNSYYEGVGPYSPPKNKQGTLSRPWVAEVMAYAEPL